MLRRKFDGDSPPVGNARYEGYCADLAERVATRLRFNYTLRVIRDDKYGEVTANGSWNGMLGELMRSVWDIYTSL